MPSDKKKSKASEPKNDAQEMETQVPGEGETDPLLEDEETGEEKTRLYILPNSSGLPIEEEDLLGNSDVEPLDVEHLDAEPLDVVALGDELDTHVDSPAISKSNPPRSPKSRRVEPPLASHMLHEEAIDFENPLESSAITEERGDEDDSEKTMLMHDAFSAVAKGEITDSFGTVNPKDYGRIQFTDREGQIHEFILDKNRCKVGRFDDSEIFIPDESVSRNHAELIIEKDKFFVNDLGSLNKTRLNGKALKDRRELKHNDKIDFGDVKAVFFAPGYEEQATIPEIKKAPSKMDPKMLIGGAIVVGCVIVLSVYLAQKGTTQLPKGFIEEFKPPPVQPKSEEPRKDPKQLLIQVENLFQEGNWETALQICQEVQKEFPPYVARAEDYIQRINFEKENADKLKMANALFQDEYYVPALEMLKKIDPSSKASVSANYIISEIESKTGVVNQQKKQEEADKFVEKGEAAFQKKQYEVALDSATKALRLVPDHASAKDLRKRTIENLPKQPPKPKKDEVATTSTQTPEVEPPKPAAFPENIEDPELKKLFFQGLDLYYAGKNDEAVTFFLKLYQAKPKEDVGQKAAEYAKNVRTVKDNFALGKKALDGGDYEKSVGHFQKAFDADQKIFNHTQGNQTVLIRSSLGQAQANYGGHLFQVGKFPQAKRAWDAALKLDKDNAQSKAGLAQLATRAQTRFEEAYVMAETDPQTARLIWEEILQIVDSDNDYYKKAESRLKGGR